MKNTISKLLFFISVSVFVNAQDTDIDLFKFEQSKSKKEDYPSYFERVEAIKINRNILNSKKDFEIPLFNNEKLRLAYDTIYKGFGNRSSSHFKSRKIEGDAIIIQSEDNIIGTITYKNEVYQVHTSKTGSTFLAKLDQSKFPPEKCYISTDSTSVIDSIKKVKDEQTIGGTTSTTFNASSSLSNSCNIRVIVAYTPSAASNSSNILNLVQLAVSEANQSYINSQISTRIELAYAYQTTYTESGNYDTDIDRFYKQSDNYMDEIHDLRNKYSADACVLFINDDQACGQAKTIKAQPHESFCMVHYSCATGNYSFAHELGHLIGARHDSYVDNTNNPYSDGHGYVNVASRWRTIMAYNTQCQDNNVNCTRIQYWSNPNVNYNNLPTGVSGSSNNARVLNERMPSVKNFRTPTTNVLLQNLTISNGQYADIVAKNKIEANTNYNINSGAISNLTASNQIRLGAGFRANQGSNFRARTTTIDDCCSTGEIAPYMASNATFPYNICNSSPSQFCVGFGCATNFSVQITNILGQSIYQGSGTVSDGIACIWNGSGASSGLYFANITATNSTQSVIRNIRIQVTTSNCRISNESEFSQIKQDSILAESSIYPNPSNGIFKIEYQLHTDTNVDLKIVNAFGEIISHPINNKNQLKGNYSLNLNISGNSSGIYYYILSTQLKSETKKIILTN